MSGVMRPTRFYRLLSPRDNGCILQAIHTITRAVFRTAGLGTALYVLIGLRTECPAK
jgi:hypothetical protein